MKRRRGQRLAAHNERRQFASQTRSCGCLPRRGKHCSHPGFAPLNRGPCSQPRNPSLRCKCKTKPGADARLRAGHARPLRTTVNGSRTKGACGWLPLPFSPTKTKKRDGHCPVSFFLKKKEKNRTSRRRLNANGTTPLQVIPSLRIRQGALVFFLFSCRSEALAFDILIVHYFCRICKMRACTTCYIYSILFCIVCTIVHG